ncbi:hypothetical protein HPB51_020914 [Rhipicephalus microplus]|uniref:THAP-type domain-containing protein n=1 Tax=Rhipicephalus microplus TaxID=6941 RepID=A0A9J6EP37_RHIMP|nr:hypothetical protein HPB51_020914 [Rhipicephalus microplus]
MESGVKKKTTQAHCFAPGCSSGYVSSRRSGQRVSLFSVPKEPERLKAWQRAVPRAYQVLDASSRICELHFDEQYIVRSFKHTINSVTVTILRNRPVLTSDAIPTVFPNLPQYLSKKAPQKRKSKTSTCGLPVKSPRHETSNAACTDEVDVLEEGSASPEVISPVLPDVGNCRLPSAYWTRQPIAGECYVTAFTVCALHRESLYFEKVVLFVANGSSVHTNVFVQATKVNSLEITDVAMAEDLLRHVDKIIPCKRFGEESEFSPNPKRKEKTHGGKVFSASCFGVAQSAKQACPQCKYLRKLLQNQASYRRRGNTRGRRASYKLKLRTAQLKRSRLTILKGKSVI